MLEFFKELNGIVSVLSAYIWSCFQLSVVVVVVVVFQLCKF